MKEKICKLIDVKSIVTIVSLAVFAYLSVIGRIEAKDFMTVFLIIIGFYFGVQHEKKSVGGVSNGNNEQGY